jgi:hypothetical protein
MSKKIIAIISIFTFFLVCCKNKNGKANADNLEDTIQRFPLIELLQNDADDVQKIPYFIYQITTNLHSKKKIDSTIINREQFKKIVAPILNADIRSDKAKKLYTESSFEDLALRTISVLVKANNGNTQPQSITANLDNVKSLLKNATITFNKQIGDTAITEKYFWKVGKSLTIATSKKINDSILQKTKKYINWNELN